MLGGQDVVREEKGVMREEAAFLPIGGHWEGAPYHMHRLAYRGFVILSCKSCDCVGTRQPTSVGEMGKYAPEMWLSKEPKVATIKVAVVEHCACELELDFTTFSSICALKDFVLLFSHFRIEQDIEILPKHCYRCKELKSCISQNS